MQVRTLFFAAYRDLVGAGELDVQVPEGAHVRDLVQSLRDQGGAYAALPAEPAIAVNMTYVGPDHALEAGDEVAFIPPVAGG